MLLRSWSLLILSLPCVLDTAIQGTGTRAGLVLEHLTLRFPTQQGAEKQINKRVRRGLQEEARSTSYPRLLWSSLWVFSLSPHPSSRAGTVRILQMSRVRHREGRRCPQGCTGAQEHGTWGAGSIPLTAAPHLPITLIWRFFRHSLVLQGGFLVPVPLCGTTTLHGLCAGELWNKPGN